MSEAGDRPEIVELEVDEDLLRDLPPAGDPWRENELLRRVRIREDAARPLGVNLATGIALSEFAIEFKGAATRRR